MGLWNWVLDRYARPGVAPICLTLQDEHGQNAPLLLAAAWAAAQARTLDIDAAVALTRGWEIEVVAPLRAARRGLKTSRSHIPDSGREILRETVKAVELEAERLLLAAIEKLAWPGDAGDVEATLTVAAEAWARPNSSPPPADKVAALAAALLG